MDYVSRDEYLSLHGPYITLCGPPRDLECSICTDEWNEENKTIVTIHCGHIFHEECIPEWFSTPDPRIGLQRNSCPICRIQCFNPNYTHVNVEDFLFVPLPDFENHLRECGSRLRSIMDSEVRHFPRYYETYLTITTGPGPFNRFLHAAYLIYQHFRNPNHHWMPAVYHSFSNCLHRSAVSDEGLIRILGSIVRGLVIVTIISQHRGSMRWLEWLELIRHLAISRNRAISSENLPGPEARQRPCVEVELFDIIWMGLVMTGPSPRFETGYSLQGLRRVCGIHIMLTREPGVPGVFLDEDRLWDDESDIFSFTIPELEQRFEIEIHLFGNVGLDQPRQTLTFIEHIPGTIREFLLRQD